jgi:hypothetical protein
MPIDWLDAKGKPLDVKADGKGTWSAGNWPYVQLQAIRQDFELKGGPADYNALDIEAMIDAKFPKVKPKERTEKSESKEAPAAPGAEVQKSEPELDLSYQQGVIVPAQESTSECRKTEPAKVQGHFVETIYGFEARLKGIKVDGGDEKPRIKILTLVTTDLKAVSDLDYVVGNILKISIPVTEWVNGTNPKRDEFDEDAKIDAEIDAELEKDEVAEPEQVTDAVPAPADIQINSDADHTPVEDGEVKTTPVCPACGGELVKNPDDPAGLKCVACGTLVADPACEVEEGFV